MRMFSREKYHICMLSLFQELSWCLNFELFPWLNCDRRPISYSLQFSSWKCNYCFEVQWKISGCCGISVGRKWAPCTEAVSSLLCPHGCPVFYSNLALLHVIPSLSNPVSCHLFKLSCQLKPWTTTPPQKNVIDKWNNYSIAIVYVCLKQTLLKEVMR